MSIPKIGNKESEKMKNEEIVKRWTAEYWAVVYAGWKSIPAEMKEYFSKEDQAAMLRGMMVDSGKCGINPDAKTVIGIIESEHLAEMAKAKEAPKTNGISKDVNATLAPPKTKEFDQDPKQLADWKGRAYNREKLFWEGCPNDPRHRIEDVTLKDHVTGKIRGKTQKCDDCQIWLNPDGSQGKQKEVKK